MTASTIGEGQGSLLARVSETLLVTFALLLFMTGLVLKFPLTPLVVGILQGVLTKPKNFSTTLIVAILSFSVFFFVIASFARQMGDPININELFANDEIYLMALIVIGLVVGDYIGKFIRRRVISLIDDTESDETVETQQDGEQSSQEMEDDSTHHRRIKLINGYMKALEPGLGYVVAIITAVLAYLGSG